MAKKIAWNLRHMGLFAIFLLWLAVPCLDYQVGLPSTFSVNIGHQDDREYIHLMLPSVLCYAALTRPVQDLFIWLEGLLSPRRAGDQWNVGQRNDKTNPPEMKAGYHNFRRPRL